MSATETPLGRILEYLAEEGYRPSDADDRGVDVSHGDVNLRVRVDPGDPEFFTISALIGPYEADDRATCLEVASELANTKKVLKAAVDGDMVRLSAELFVPDVDAFLKVLRRGIRQASHGVDWYVRRFQERKEASEGEATATAESVS